jgi:hypothetical protein
MSPTTTEQIETFIKQLQELKKQIEAYVLQQFVLKKFASLKI